MAEFPSPAHHFQDVWASAVSPHLFPCAANWDPGYNSCFPLPGNMAVRLFSAFGVFRCWAQGGLSRAETPSASVHAHLPYNSGNWISSVCTHYIHEDGHFTEATNSLSEPGDAGRIEAQRGLTSLPLLRWSQYIWPMGHGSEARSSLRLTCFALKSDTPLKHDVQKDAGRRGRPLLTPRSSKWRVPRLRPGPGRHSTSSSIHDPRHSPLITSQARIEQRMRHDSGPLDPRHGGTENPPHTPSLTPS